MLKGKEEFTIHVQIHQQRDLIYLLLNYMAIKSTESMLDRISSNKINEINVDITFNSINLVNQNNIELDINNLGLNDLKYLD